MGKQGHLSDDREVVKACLDGDQRAQRLLFERYSGRMLGICYRYCCNHEDASDAMQQGFIKVFRLLHKFNFKSRLETWMTRIMINTAIDQFKKGLKFELYEDAQKVSSLGQEDHDFIELDEETEVKESDILEVIAELPDGYRVVFNLYAIDGASHREIAAHLGISEGTSKSQLARARKLLQKLLKERGIIG